MGPILAADTLTLSVWFGVDFTRIAQLTGYFLLGAGVAGPLIVVPSARVWGKRHLFVAAACVLVASSAWAGASAGGIAEGKGNSGGGSYTSFLWARVVQGAGSAPFESLLNAVVGDLYFVHVCIHTASIKAYICD